MRETWSLFAQVRSLKMREYEIKANGKINLGLDVVGKREDGYHLVRMIMQSVRLFDRLEFTRTKASDIVIESNLRFLPVNENNLIYKAIEMVRSEYGISDGMHVKLDKRIPVAGGMAGGSSDAAATLKAMNTMFELGMDSERMNAMALKLGADVPYCLLGGTALAEGIGEKLTPLASVPDANILLVKPQISVSTPAIYSKYDETEGLEHPDIDGIRAAIEAGDISEICRKMGNILEPVTTSMNPVIADIERKILEMNADGVLMSGSGPTVFAIFTDRKAAEHAFYEFKGGEYSRGTFLTSFI